MLLLAVCLPLFLFYSFLYILYIFVYLCLYNFIFILLVLWQYQKLAQFILPSIFNRHNKQQQNMQFPFPQHEHEQVNDHACKQKQVVGKSYLDTLVLKAIYYRLKSTSTIEQPIDETVKFGKEKWAKLLTCQETLNIKQAQLFIICGEIFINGLDEKMQEINNWVCKNVELIYGEEKQKGDETEEVTQKKQESEYSLWSLESQQGQIDTRKGYVQQNFNDKNLKYQKVIKRNAPPKFKEKKPNNLTWSQELDSNLQQLPFLLDISTIQNQENNGKQMIKEHNITEFNPVSPGLYNRQNNTHHDQHWNTHVQKVTNYLSTVLTFRSQLNLLMQHIKIKKPQFTRSRYMDRYYVCVDVNMNSEYTRYQNSRFLGYGLSANLKTAYEQACFIVLRDIYLKYSSLWYKFVSIKQSKGLK